jgi:hypothetical protein
MTVESSGLGADLRSFEAAFLFSFVAIIFYWALILHICSKWILKEDTEIFSKVPVRKYEAAPRLFSCFIGFLATFLCSFFLFELQVSSFFTLVVSLAIGSATVTGFTLLFGMES